MRHGHALAVAVTSLLIGACIRDQLVPCGDTSCPVGLVCTPSGTCGTPEQIAQCDGKADGDECGEIGICAGGLCLPNVCGDLVVAFQEECELGAEQSCADAGGYGLARAVCTAQCTSDVTSCPRCGDGVVQPAEEACDTEPSVSCNPQQVGSYECAGCRNVGRCSDLGYLQFDLANAVTHVWAASRTELYALSGPSLYRAIGGSFTYEVIDAGVLAGESPVVGWGATGALWVAGTGGLLAHHDGTSWVRIPVAGLTTMPTLRAVHVVDTTTAIVVGDDGTIIEVVGAVATRVASGLTTARLVAISGDATRALVVGDGGIVLERLGGVWSVDPAAPVAGIDLTMVWARSPTTAIVVDTNGVWLERTGTGASAEWTGFPVPPPAFARSLWGTADDDLFAVGDDPDPDPGLELLHFDGDTWVTIVREDTEPSPTGPGTVIPDGGQFLARGTGLAMFDAGWGKHGAGIDVYRFADATWHTLGTQVYRRGRLVATAPAPITGMFAVGSDVFVLTLQFQTQIIAKLWRLDGTLVELHSQRDDFFFRGWGTSRDDLYLIGGSGLLYHWTPTAGLVEVTDLPGGSKDVWGSAANDIYVAGADGLWHHDGVTWARVPEAGTACEAVWGTSATDVHVVGAYAAHFDGTSWSGPELGRFDVPLGALRGTSPRDIYSLSSATGSSVIRHFDGRAWRDIGGFPSGTADGWLLAASPNRVTFSTGDPSSSESLVRSIR